MLTFELYLTCSYKDVFADNAASCYPLLLALSYPSYQVTHEVSETAHAQCHMCPCWCTVSLVPILPATTSALPFSTSCPSRRGEEVGSS